MKKSNHILLTAIIPLLMLPGSAYAIELTDWLFNLSRAVIPFLGLLEGVAYLGGLFFIISGVSKLRKCAQAQTMGSSQESLSGPLIYILVGTVLMSAGAFVSIGMGTIFGDSSIMAYSGGVDLPSRVLGPVILIIRCLGYLAFVKGFFMLAKMGGHNTQPGHLSKAVTHIFGGILAINIVSTYNVLLNTLQGTSI